MKKPASPEQLAVDILERSSCSVKVGAAIVDRQGRIISWGWNSVGPTGLGLHSECHAIQRANRTRLAGGTIYVASTRARNRKIVLSKPCPECEKVIVKNKLTAIWRDNVGEWNT